VQGGHNGGLFSASAGAPAGFFNWAAIFGEGMDFYGLEQVSLYPQTSEFT
jgi:hypothetical protein